MKGHKLVFNDLLEPNLDLSFEGEKETKKA